MKRIIFLNQFRFYTSIFYKRIPALLEMLRILPCPLRSSGRNVLHMVMGPIRLTFITFSMSVVAIISMFPMKQIPALLISPQNSVNMLPPCWEKLMDPGNSGTVMLDFYLFWTEHWEFFLTWMRIKCTFCQWEHWSQIFPQICLKKSSWEVCDFGTKDAVQV